MPSFEYKTDELSRVGARFVAHVNEELQRALIEEKAERKLTQQAIADILQVNRSVVNRRFMGLENLTVRTIAETLWAIGWEPFFEARRNSADEGENENISSAGRFTYDPPKASIDRKPSRTGGTGGRVLLETAE